MSSPQFLRKLNFPMKQLKGFHIISYPILMCKIKTLNVAILCMS